MQNFDYLIVGAGFAGLTLAERLTTQLGKSCLMVEKRNHLGGNAYDEFDKAGVLIHKYGPHYFRTNSDRIISYLSGFTEWHHVTYQILSFCRNRLWNFPINLNTFEQFLGRPSTTEEMEEWLQKRRVLIEKPKNSEEAIVSQIGWELYEMFFKGYTEKQWRRSPADLDPSVCSRIPIRSNRDNRYLRESFQALPSRGYHHLFENMVRACGPNLKILLKTNYREVIRSINFRHLIYTGPIDEFYDYRFGALPYRSLRFEPESFGPEALSFRQDYARKPGFWQPAMQINYPDSESFTRIVEIKHATGQIIDHTTIVREYPEDYGPGKEAYYPIPAPDSHASYQKYHALAEKEKNVSFVGRLATYRYYNMDQVVGMALAEFARLAAKEGRTG